MGIENVRTRYCNFLKSGLVFHSKACNEKSTNTSENRDYNCRGQLLSRLLQHPVYTTWLAVLSGQSLQRKDWKVRFGPRPGDCHSSMRSTTIQIRDTPTPQLLRWQAFIRNPLLTHSKQSSVWHDVFVVFWQIVDIPFIFHNLAQLENHPTSKKKGKAQNITIHLFQKWDMCDTWQDKKKKEHWCHIPKSLCHVDSLSSSQLLNHAHAVCTRNAHMENLKFSWWRGAHYNRQKNNITNHGIILTCWGQMCLCLEDKGPLFTQIWKCLYFFKIIIWHYLQSWREMSTMILILYQNKKINHYSVIVLLFKSSYLTITRWLHRHNNNNEIILVPFEPSPTSSSTLHLRTTKAKLPIWSRPQAMFSQPGMNSCLLKGILTISENCQRT